MLQLSVDFPYYCSKASWFMLTNADTDTNISLACLKKKNKQTKQKWIDIREFRNAVLFSFIYFPTLPLFSTILIVLMVLKLSIWMSCCNQRKCKLLKFVVKIETNLLKGWIQFPIASTRIILFKKQNNVSIGRNSLKLFLSILD